MASATEPIDAATHHPDPDARGPEQSPPPPSYAVQVGVCLRGALESARDSVGDEAKATMRAGSILAARAALRHLHATAAVWAPKAPLLARMVVSAAFDSLGGLERR